jgi:SAM-dependent methyltransferase
MVEGNYVFENVAVEPELRRLRALEAVFDPGTQRHLLATGEWAGRRCLEVGAGAGSIAVWMQRQVGSSGRVVAVDTSLRFLSSLPGLELVEADVNELSLAPASFDVVHARYVLVHNPEPERILRRMQAALKPGGWLLVEEPDFTAARAFAGDAELSRAFARINRAIAAMFGGRGLDPAFGSRLPELVERQALSLMAVEADAGVERGGSPLAAMMSLSAEQLGDKYVATACATSDDVARYREFARDPGCWAIYYSTVRVLANKPQTSAQTTPKS